MLMHYPFCHWVIRQTSVRLSSYDTYIGHFSYGIRPFIQHIIDIEADGNCGFRTIAALLGLEEDGWLQVRNNLLQELDSYTQYYEPIFSGFVALNEIRHSIVHFMEGALYAYWMTMLECGHLIAFHYHIVLYLLSVR